MAIIPTRFDKEIIKKIDELVSAGLYRSRSDAIKKLVAEGLKRKQVKMINDKTAILLKKMLEKRKKGEQPIKIITQKTAAELVAEGRTRDEYLR